MAVHGGPNIVTDGLVLSLDKYDEISYPGEPTTNLISDGKWESAAAWSSPGWGGYGNSSMMTLVTTDLPNDPSRGAYGGTGPVLQFGPSGWGSGVSGISYSLGTSGSGTESTVSFWWRITNTGSGNMWSGFYQNPGLDSRDNSLSVGSTTDWAYYTITRTWTNSGAHSYRFITDSNSHDGTDFTMQVWGIQFEVNSHATKWVNGSRSATAGWKDLSGNGNHADLTSLTYSTTNIRNTPNNDFSFVQSSNNMVKRSALTQTTSMTCCAWIYPTNGNGGIINTISSSNKDGFYFGFYDSYNPTVYAADSNGGDWSVARPSSAVSANTWSYVCAVLDGVANTCTIFINGTQIASSATSGGSGGWMWGNNDLQIGGNFGNWNSNTEFDGRIEIVQIYGEALSAAQIAQNFNAQRGRFGV